MSSLQIRLRSTIDNVISNESQIYYYIIQTYKYIVRRFQDAGVINLTILYCTHYFELNF